MCDRPWFLFSLDRRSLHLRFQTDQTIFASLWPYSHPILQPHVSVGTLRTEICKLLRMMLLAWPGPSACAVEHDCDCPEKYQEALSAATATSYCRPTPPLKTGIEMGIVKASTSANSRLHQLSPYSYNLAPAQAAGLPWHWIVNHTWRPRGLSKSVISRVRIRGNSM